MWILPENWRLIDTRIAEFLNGDNRNSRGINHKIKVILQEDQSWRVSNVGSTVKSPLTSDPPLIQEAWNQMRGWYKDAVDHPLPPARVAIANITVKRVKLYWPVPPPGQPIPVGVQQFSVDEAIPEDKDIAWAVSRIHWNRSGGL